MQNTDTRSDAQAELLLSIIEDILSELGDASFEASRAAPIHTEREGAVHDALTAIEGVEPMLSEISAMLVKAERGLRLTGALS